MAATGLPGPDELAILEPLRDKIPPEVFTQAFEPSRTDGSGMIRAQQREAYQLLQEAGWRIVDDKMVDTTGKPVTIEFLLAQTEFERILLPFKRNLADLGINLVIRRVDVSQFINRIRSRDFDMLVGSFPQSTSPGNEQREFWKSSSADKPGSRNYMGLKDPAIDQLVEELIDADSRKSLVAHAKALDRVLQFGYYVIPNWHIKTFRVAYWDHLGHPKVPPRYDVGTATWWAKPDVKPAVIPDTNTSADPASGGD
jgi:microcin C transport system substrate-binding protein